MSPITLLTLAIAAVPREILSATNPPRVLTDWEGSAINPKSVTSSDVLEALAGAHCVCKTLEPLLIGTIIEDLERTATAPTNRQVDSMGGRLDP